jgi:transposase
VDKEIDSIITGDDELKLKRQRIESLKGIGRVSANVVLSELPELGTLTDKQAAALVGVAPFPKDSGKHRGKRLTRGGRRRVRRGLYMAAQVASRYNHVLSEFYKRLRKKGKAHHVAVIAVMRKMVCLLNRMLANPEFNLAET